MKQMIFTITVILFSQFLFGQYSTQATLGSEKFSKIGSKDAISVRIYDRNIKNIKKDWKKRMMWKQDADKVDVGTEIFVDNATIKSVSANTIDIYGKFIINAAGYIEFKVAVNLGGVYLSKGKQPKKYAAMVDFMSKFAKEQTTKGLQGRILSEQDKLENLNKDKKGFQQDIVDYNEEIAELEQKILDAKSNIERTKRLITGKDTEILKQETEMQKLRAITVN